MILDQGANYYNDKLSWSSSMFGRLEDDPDDFHKWFTEGTEDECADVYAKGQYLHDYMARMIDRTYMSECAFYFAKCSDRRKKEYKEEVANVNRLCCYVLTLKDKNRIERLADSFLNSDMFQNTLARATNVDVEIGYRRQAEISLKGKLDLVVQIGNKHHVFDWKTSSNFSDFESKAWLYNYHRQAEVYRYISNADSFCFVVFDMITMEDWKIVKVDKDGSFAKAGRTILRDSIKLAKEYLKKGVTDNLKMNIEKLNMKKHSLISSNKQIVITI